MMRTLKIPLLERSSHKCTINSNSQMKHTEILTIANHFTFVRFSFQFYCRGFKCSEFFRSGIFFAANMLICLLQSIKAATEESLCGDRISEELLDSADDLYHMRIPSKWSQLGGESSPPPTWSLAAWFTDLGNRFSHIDRIIVQVNNNLCEGGLMFLFILIIG